MYLVYMFLQCFDRIHVNNNVIAPSSFNIFLSNEMIVSCNRDIIQQHKKEAQCFFEITRLFTEVRLNVFLPGILRYAEHVWSK